MNEWTRASSAGSTSDETERPEITTFSEEFDACPLADDDVESLASLIDGIAEEWSPFHEMYDLYIQGVGRRTSQLLDGWIVRLVTVQNDNTRGRVGLCLDPHDLCRRGRRASRRASGESRRRGRCSA